MYGGSITNNTVDSNNASYGTGGGVYVSWTSKFVMSGGEISGNTANKFGGGVYASALARSNAHDASDRTAEIVFSGTAKIKNNTVNSSVNNVYLDSSTTAFETVSAALTIQGSLEGQIGVTAGAAAPAIVATGADPVKNYGAIITSDDSRYEIDSIGTELDSKTGAIANGTSLKSIKTEETNGYKKAIIEYPIEVNAQEVNKNIYIRFKLNDEAVLAALNKTDDSEFKTLTEINSYSTLDANGKAYAGIDRDSNPGNAEINKSSDFEDDTRAAPGIQLAIEGNRQLSEIVFEDK